MSSTRSSGAVIGESQSQVTSHSSSSSSSDITQELPYWMRRLSENFEFIERNYTDTAHKLLVQKHLSHQKKRARQFSRIRSGSWGEPLPEILNITTTEDDFESFKTSIEIAGQFSAMSVCFIHDLQKEIDNLKQENKKLEEEMIEWKVCMQLGELIDKLYTKLVHWINQSCGECLEDWGSYSLRLRLEKEELRRSLPGSFNPFNYNFQVDYSSSRHIGFIRQQKELMPLQYRLLQALDEFGISGEQFNFFIRHKSERNLRAHQRTINCAALRANFNLIYQRTEERNALTKLFSLTVD